MSGDVSEHESARANRRASAPASGGLPVRLGDVVAGKFRVDRVIAHGGMGIVVEAMHLELDERVALKFLKPEALENETVLQRFKREAKAAAKLKGEHVMRVLDVGVTEPGQVPYIVMEYLEGQDLGNLLQGAPLPIREIVGWVIQACEALAEAHARGIVHRDIKPENLFLVDTGHGPGSIKLLDFGISKVAIGVSPLDDPNVFQTREMLGTPIYMSPEQVRSTRAVDARTDIWSLGAVLYELLAGRPPFTGATVMEVCAQVLENRPVPVHELRPEVGDALSRIVSRCLEKDPSARFQSVAELAVALFAYADPRTQASVERIGAMLAKVGVETPDLGSIPALRVVEAPTVRSSPDIQLTLPSRPSSPTQMVTARSSGGSTDGGSERPSTRAPLVIGAGVAVAGAALAVFLLGRGQAAGPAAPAPPVGSPTAVSAPVAAGTAPVDVQPAIPSAAAAAVHGAASTEVAPPASAPAPPIAPLPERTARQRPAPRPRATEPAAATPAKPSPLEIRGER
ncbi:MAG: serine/threonine protein kinase [Polyangiaceae bacterium]|nr:serine/threonine protein kinase [Polyangiaceae bacterium]